ncbi:MAG: hypothetical protein EBU90_30605, partial [Proteobacteria bacterium]|nr:hypothetical protein [Pseudomonadota bacterium]
LQRVDDRRAVGLRLDELRDGARPPRGHGLDCRNGLGEGQAPRVPVHEPVIRPGVSPNLDRDEVVAVAAFERRIDRNRPRGLARELDPKPAEPLRAEDPSARGRGTLLELRGGPPRPEGALEPLNHLLRITGGHEELPLLAARVSAPSARMVRFVAHREAEHGGARSLHFGREVALVQSLHHEHSGGACLVPKARGHCLVMPRDDGVQLEAGGRRRALRIDRIIDDVRVGVQPQHGAADGDRIAPPCGFERVKVDRFGGRRSSRERDVRPARGPPRRLEERPRPPRVVQDHPLRKRRGDESMARVCDPTPRRKKHGGEERFRRARRHVHHEVANLSPRNGLEVFADRVEVPAPRERRRLDQRPRPTNKLPEATAAHALNVQRGAERVGRATGERRAHARASKSAIARSSAS